MSLASNGSVAAEEQEYNGDAPARKLDDVIPARAHAAGIIFGARYHAAANWNGATFSQRGTTNAPIYIHCGLPLAGGFIGQTDGAAAAEQTAIERPLIVGMSSQSHTSQTELPLLVHTPPLPT